MDQIHCVTPVGLVNIGNTCFMNATLQTLLAVPGLGQKSPVQAFLQAYGAKKKTAPAMARAMVERKFPAYNNFRQHDAHEWMHAFFDVVEGDDPKRLSMFRGTFQVRVQFPWATRTCTTSRSRPCPSRWRSRSRKEWGVCWKSARSDRRATSARCCRRPPSTRPYPRSRLS